MTITTQEPPIRFLLVSGQPIGEPGVWYGPIVIDAQAELQIAFEEYKKEHSANTKEPDRRSPCVLKGRRQNPEELAMAGQQGA